MQRVGVYLSIVGMCGVDGKCRTLRSKRHEFASTARHKTYTLRAVGQ